MPKTIMNNPTLWDFATVFYAKPRVQSACLTLQDSAGVNVSLLLCCCWVGKYYGELPPALATELRQLSESFTGLSIEPLRRIRTVMKHRNDSKWPIKESAWEALREKVKAVELNAEHLLLQGLEQLIEERMSTLSQQNSKFSEDDIITECLKNIHVCLMLSTDNEEATSILLASIVKAVAVLDECC